MKLNNLDLNTIMKSQSIGAALDLLEKLIREGAEFPEALYKVTEHFDIDTDELTEIYDRT